MDEEFEEALKKTTELDDKNRVPAIDSPETDDVDVSMAAVQLRIAQSKAERKEQENKLRVSVATRIVSFVAGQLVLTNTMIWIYFIVMLARNQTIPSAVIISWLGSTIVEILGLLCVVARSLFPFRDKHRDIQNEKQPKPMN